MPHWTWPCMCVIRLPRMPNTLIHTSSWPPCVLPSCCSILGIHPCVWITTHVARSSIASSIMTRPLNTSGVPKYTPNWWPWTTSHMAGNSDLWQNQISFLTWKLIVNENYEKDCLFKLNSFLGGIEKEIQGSLYQRGCDFLPPQYYECVVLYNKVLY
jgi:hypothetical protein